MFNALKNLAAEGLFICKIYISCQFDQLLMVYFRAPVTMGGMKFYWTQWQCFRGRLWELSIIWYYTDMFAQLINWISLPFLHGKQHYTLDAQIMIIINVDDFESGLDAFMEDRSVKCSHSRLNVTLMRTIYKRTLAGKLSIRMPESLLPILRVTILD